MFKKDTIIPQSKPEKKEESGKTPLLRGRILFLSFGHSSARSGQRKVDLTSATTEQGDQRDNVNPGTGVYATPGPDGRSSGNGAAEL
jgi:hypothetical protein